MGWTTTPPSEPGYYWLKRGPHDDEPEVVQLTSSGDVYIPAGARMFATSEFSGGLWFGPLESPAYAA